MTPASSWVEALNISPENLSQWSSQAPDGKPLLVWCLEQGHVQLEDYFAWAQEFFKLPVLDSSFLPQVDAQLIEQAKTDGDWHPWRFPIEKWDDVTIVACVEPPTDQDHPTMSFVLADPRAMSEVWGPNVTQSNIPALPELPEAGEEPEGFSVATKPFTLNLEGNLFGAETPAETHATAPVAEPPSPPPPAMEDDSLLVGMPPEPSERTVVKPMLKVVPKEEPANEEPAIDVPPGEIEPAVDKAFSEILAKYNHVVLMKINEQKAVLFKADAQLKNVKADRATVELSYPTFLRIVSKTALPYHGYLVDSPAHRDFFEALGLKELPGCVTAVPVKRDNQVLGMLVAIGSGDLLKNDYLNLVSVVTMKLAPHLAGSWSKAS
jgi:hypothetical protein